jgi:virulence factor Mce-like protein
MAKDSLEPIPRRLLGLGMVGVLVLLLGVCVAAYNQAFTAKVPVSVMIDQASNSFFREADVRMRGVTVGRVTAAGSDGRTGQISLELKPDKVEFIPRNVIARVLPTGLFGQPYISLELPPNPVPERIQAGDVISPDRTGSSIETQTVFENLLPVLTAVRPSELASTLGAVNEGLTNRGALLGDTISRLHDYLSKFNPTLPELTQDIQALPPFTDTYSAAAPDLIEGLRNLTTTSSTLVDKRGDFAELYHQLSQTSHDLKDFFDDTGDDFVRLARNTNPIADLLERYAPQSVCFFGRLADAVPKADKAFSKGEQGNVLHITLEPLVNRGPFRPHLDEPDITDNRGPQCYDNSSPLEQYPGGPAVDGSTHPPASDQHSRLHTFASDQAAGDNRHLEGEHDGSNEHGTHDLHDPRPHGRGNSPGDEHRDQPNDASSVLIGRGPGSSVGTKPLDGWGER